MAGINLLVCDLGTAVTANTWVIPVKREVEVGISGNHGATLLAANVVETGHAADFGALDAFT
jgi:hypothetical protein